MYTVEPFVTLTVGFVTASLNSIVNSFEVVSLAVTLETVGAVTSLEIVKVPVKVLASLPALFSKPTIETE